MSLMGLPMSEPISLNISAALGVNGEILERFELAPRGHAQLILPMVDELLAEAGISLADIDALAFGRGPGAFTGVRIAVGVAQGIAFAADLPVVPVSTLAALAQGSEHDQVLVAVDARMDEIYYGAYQRNAQGLVELCGREQVLAPEQLLLPVVVSAQGDWFGVGSGWSTYEDELRARCGDSLGGWNGQALPHAREVALLGAADFAAGVALAAEQALPVYLRDEVAWKKIGE